MVQSNLNLIFKIGHILRIEVNMPKRPQKVGICISTNPSAVFYINSEDREIYDCIPIEVKAARYFPTDTSFIGTANVIDCEGKKVIRDYGPIDEQECLALIEKVRSSNRLTGVQIKEIVKNLEAFCDELKK